MSVFEANNYFKVFPPANDSYEQHRFRRLTHIAMSVFPFDGTCKGSIVRAFAHAQEFLKRHPGFVLSRWAPIYAVGPWSELPVIDAPMPVAPRRGMADRRLEDDE